jgi:ribonucleoside-diphosphate reductase alpha chain
MRAHLPSRRHHELFTIEHWGQKFHVGIGRAVSGSPPRPTGPVLEVWINTGKTGTQTETLFRDSAVLMSLALQYGVPISDLCRAIIRDLDGNPSGPIGQLLEILEYEHGETNTSVRMENRGE